MNAPTSRTRVRRHPDRGAYDRATIDAILDEVLVAHVAVADAHGPVCIPVAYAREGDRLVLHGSTASRTLRLLAAGEPCCVTVTVVDGLVLARSQFHHSMNYRSVVVLGRAAPITDPREQAAALACIVERMEPGRSTTARPPTASELRQTTVVALPLDEASAKIRTGGPVDEPEDYALPVWAGVVPLQVAHLEPVRDLATAP